MEIPVVRRANATKDITAMNSFIHRPVGAFPLELRPCVSPFPFGGSGCLPTSASLTSTPCNGISSEVDMCNVSYDLGSSLAAVSAWLCRDSCETVRLSSKDQFSIPERDSKLVLKIRWRSTLENDIINIEGGDMGRTNGARIIGGGVKRDAHAQFSST